MTKYHAHEAVIATGPDTGNLPDAGDFHTGIPAELHPLIIGPVRAPGEQGGVRYASYVFLPEGEDSWIFPTLDGDDARDLFVQRVKDWLPGFEVVRVEYGTKPESDEPRLHATVWDEQ